jgi:formate hydrogenlyase transcriptional activator
MDAPQTFPSPPAPSPRSALMLRLWEAISAERELPGVLATLADVLVPLMPFDSVGIIDFATIAGGTIKDEPHKLIALHVVGIPRIEGESPEQLVRRSRALAGEIGDGFPKPLGEVRPLVPYPPIDESNVRGEPYVVADLLEKDGWYDHEFHLAQSGIRSYASVPLATRGRLIAAAAFTRVKAMPFSGEDVAILRDVGHALSVATANALANEEIRKLREQLEAENSSLRAQLGQAPWFEEILAHSAALRRTLDTVEQVATTDATVLITGETGTGKELIARAIHRRSPRARGPLVKVNCAAIPDTLLASELFGHERGAFSGATERRKGRFEQAHGGTLFLDEIGELPQEMQVLLLRVLQEREFERLGGTNTLQVDVRLVAATNRDLVEEVRAGRFRSDLYYRLNVFPVHVPSLRERPEDIPPLVAHFAEKYGARFNRKISRIDRKTLAVLQAHSWPGNVRELENTVERAVILARHGVLTIDESMVRDTRATSAAPNQHVNEERAAIESALAASGGKVSGTTGAATKLNLPASTLEFRIKKLGIDKFRHRRR